MEIIDAEPHFWFLLAAGRVLFLDVACGQSAISYSVLVQLNDEESAHHAARGHQYLSELAEKINNSAIGAVDSDPAYKSRDVSPHHDDAVMNAITIWHAENAKRADLTRTG